VRAESFPGRLPAVAQAPDPSSGDVVVLDLEAPVEVLPVKGLAALPGQV
jgi:hypothetical protein